MVACWAIGAATAFFGLWFWLGTPSVPPYQSFLVRSHAWLWIALAGVIFGFPMYAFLALRGRLRQFT